MAKKTVSTKPKSTVTPDLKKLKLLVTIVDRTKALFYTDLLEQYEVNMQMVCMGHGTANNEMLDLVGLASSDKAVILYHAAASYTSMGISSLFLIAEKKFFNI